MKSTQPSNQVLSVAVDSLIVQANEIDKIIDQAVDVDVIPDQFNQIISANNQNSKLFIDNVGLEEI